MRASIKRTKYKSQAVKWLAINLWQEVHLKQRLFFIAFKRVKGPQVIWSAFELSQAWRSYLRIYSLKHQLKVRKNTKAFLIRLVRLWIAPFHALRKSTKNVCASYSKPQMCENCHFFQLNQNIFKWNMKVHENKHTSTTCRVTFIVDVIIAQKVRNNRKIAAKTRFGRQLIGSLPWPVANLIL